MQTKVALYALVGALFVFSYAITNYFIKRDVGLFQAYYTTIENQEKIKDDVKVTQAEVALLEACAKKGKSLGETCMRDFYDTYTMTHGPGGAFAHLARLQKEHPDLLPGCHYISHGIGHATLRLNKNDTHQAFLVMQQGSFFKNVATCGNGYFHGVIEEAARGITHSEQLAQKLSKICSGAGPNTSCYHGAGHAAIIQKNYDIQAMIKICDRISSRPDDVFECHTGGFMEYNQLYPNVAEVRDGRMKLTLCDSLEKKYQPACYMEQSSVFEWHSNQPRNYVQNIGYCKQFPDPLNRMACVKLFAIRSVRISHYPEVPAMCRNTTTKHEQILCTAVVASKVARSMGEINGTGYRSVVRSVCNTLNPLYASYCQHVVFENSKQLFYTSADDLMFSTWKDLLFGWYSFYNKPNDTEKSQVCKNRKV